VTARVRPEFVGPGDPLVNVNGTTNAVVFEAEPVGHRHRPGAGPQLAGQRVLSDIIAVAGQREQGLSADAATDTRCTETCPPRRWTMVWGGAERTARP
jgi:homoserine dehydrogenase-like protein